ncbi:MAG TPA: (2Fe-2S) ferredoxin domain-containing protein [Clostridia bacterium]|nr:(2Fe-2S) ferredoxin domain-containing protein [Clostridia bacterium]
MSIKSLDELMNIRKKHEENVSLRDNNNNSQTKLLVGMATCGIASGARETLNELLKEIKAQGLDNVKIVQVGCLGYCHSEPTVEINVPGEDPILYGPVTVDRVKELVERHIINHEIIEELVINQNFDRA